LVSLKSLCRFLFTGGDMSVPTAMKELDNNRRDNTFESVLDGVLLKNNIFDYGAVSDNNHLNRQFNSPRVKTILLKLFVITNHFVSRYAETVDTNVAMDRNSGYQTRAINLEKLVRR
jgi:hypothetical protein